MYNAAYKLFSWSHCYDLLAVPCTMLPTNSSVDHIVMTCWLCHVQCCLQTLQLITLLWLAGCAMYNAAYMPVWQGFHCYCLSLASGKTFWMELVQSSSYTVNNDHFLKSVCEIWVRLYVYEYILEGVSLSHSVRLTLTESLCQYGFAHSKGCMLVAMLAARISGCVQNLEKPKWLGGKLQVWNRLSWLCHVQCCLQTLQLITLLWLVLTLICELCVCV